MKLLLGPLFVLIAPTAAAEEASTLSYRRTPQTDDLASFIRTNNISSIEDLLKRYPPFQDPQRPWKQTLIPNSKSLQSGPRILLRSPDSSTTLSFNLNPTNDGYEGLEIKEFDSTPGAERFVFDDFQFKSDRDSVVAAKRKPSGDDFSGNHHLNRDLRHHSRADCIECHMGGEVRFNVKEIEREFASMSAEEKQRLTQMLKNPSGRLAAVGGSTRSGLVDYRSSQIPFSARIVARKISETFDREPQIPYALLAIHRGCPLHNFLTTEAQWKRSIDVLRKRVAYNGQQGLFADRDAIVKSLDELKWESDPAQRMKSTYALQSLAGQIIEQNRETAKTDHLIDAGPPGGPEDEFVANLMILWDPIAESIKQYGDSPTSAGLNEQGQHNWNKTVDKMKVTAWAPAHSIAGTYNFQGSLNEYLEAISKVSSEKVPEGAAAQNLNCSQLAQRYAEGLQRRPGGKTSLRSDLTAPESELVTPAPKSLTPGKHQNPNQLPI